MFGIMGMGGAFINAAGSKNIGDVINFIGSTQDPTLGALSCTDSITITSTKNGEKIVTTYEDLNNEAVSILADANTLITIKGKVTACIFAADIETGYRNLTSLKIQSKSLTILFCVGSLELTSIDTSKCPGLIGLNCGFCYNITELDMSKNLYLTGIDCNECNSLSTLVLPKTDIFNHLNCGGSYSLTKIDLSGNSQMTLLRAQGCTGLTMLDISKFTPDSNLELSGVPNINIIKSPANSENTATTIAWAITSATQIGTVYTDSAGAYYSTIETAATTAGWTIEQL